MNLNERLADICTDWKVFESVFYHLMSNAVKYSPTNSIITVRITIVPILQAIPSSNLYYHLVTTIIDSGDGYDTSKQITNNFKTFSEPYQKSSEIKGVGLGHSTASTLANYLGGDLKIVSVQKQISLQMSGTEATFSIALTSHCESYHQDLINLRTQLQQPKQDRVQIAHSIVGYAKS